MSKRKSIMIICYHNYQRQPRVQRTIEALSSEYEVSVAGYSEAKTHTIPFSDLEPNLAQNKDVYWHFNKPAFIRLPVSFYHKYIVQKRFHKPSFFEWQYWSPSRKADLAQLSRCKFDVVISHGVDTLPLAVKLAGGRVPVIFNAHEYYPLEFEQDPEWMKDEGAINTYFIRKYLKRSDYMFCVSELIQQEYLKYSHVNSVVITNATSFNALEPRKTGNPVRIIHHGAAMRARELERMADMMKYLDDRYELTLMLVPTEPAYLEELKKKYGKDPRIKFLSPVPVGDIARTCNTYDIGLFILPPVNFNWLNALPNKLFEYVQGRLCLAASPNPDMKRLVEKYSLGVTAPDYSAEKMAETITTLDPGTIDNYKANAHRYAYELSAEANLEKMRQVVKSLIMN